MKVRSGKTNRAFSLIETLVAVSIFSLAIVGIIEGITAATRTQIEIENESRAAMLAQNIMAEMEYAGEFTVNQTDNGQFTGDDARYAWMSEVLETEFEGLYEVRVTVNWNEAGAARDFQLVTYLREQAYETEDELATDPNTQQQNMGAQPSGGPSSGMQPSSTRNDAY